MTKLYQEGYCPYSMQVTHFLKRKNCKVSLHFVKYVKSKETGKPVLPFRRGLSAGVNTI